MATGVFEAQISGVCSICFKAYPKGTRIVMSKKTNDYAHADCVFPEKRRHDKDNAYSIKQPDEGGGISSHQSNPLPTPLTIDNIDDALNVSIRNITNKSEFEGIDIEKLIPLLSEYFKSLLMAQEQQFRLALILKEKEKSDKD